MSDSKQESTNRLMTLLTVVTVLCAVTITGLVVRREIQGNRVAAQQAPQLVEDWQSLQSVGHRRGAVNPMVTIVVFSDFECPACRDFTMGPLHSILSRHPGSVAVVYRHWPLEYHRVAYTAARASECAARQGKFWEFHDALFSSQDSLGVKPMNEYARTAAVGDFTEFARCSSEAARLPAIDSDIAAAKAIGATGTPTVIVNGFQYVGFPSESELEAWVTVVTDGSVGSTPWDTR